MGSLFELCCAQPFAHAMGALAFVCILGMALDDARTRACGTINPVKTLMRIPST